MKVLVTLIILLATLVAKEPFLSEKQKDIYLSRAPDWIPPATSREAVISFFGEPSFKDESAFWYHYNLEGEKKQGFVKIQFSEKKVVLEVQVFELKAVDSSLFLFEKGEKATVPVREK